jgi:hypothetical protein
LVETARQAAKSAQTHPEVRGYRESQTVLFAAAAAAVIFGWWLEQPGLISLGFPAGLSVAFLRFLERISYVNGVLEPAKTQHARNLDTFLKVYLIYSMGVLVFVL